MQTFKDAILKRASSLVEAPNIDTKPKIEDLAMMFNKIIETKERNDMIHKAYKQGYSQHMIAQVLGLAQSTVCEIVKRMSR
jgi:DNA-directed RNA polymerase specialized sigma subunit